MPKGKPSAKHVTFTEETNALDYLEKACEAIRRLTRDHKEWKCVVIGLHGALYGFAICAVKGTDWSRVTIRPDSRRLIAFDEAIKRCQSSDWITQYTHSRTVRLTDEQKDAIRFLKRVRNQIEHYVPLHWSIEEHDLSISAIDELDVVRALALDTGTVRLNQTQRQSVESCTRKAKQVLKSTQLYKDYLAAMRRSRRGRPGANPPAKDE